MWKGIDVSDNQGIIDWTQVAAAVPSWLSKYVAVLKNKIDSQGGDENV